MYAGRPTSNTALTVSTNTEQCLEMTGYLVPVADGKIDGYEVMRRPSRTYSFHSLPQASIHPTHRYPEVEPSKASLRHRGHDLCNMDQLSAVRSPQVPFPILGCCVRSLSCPFLLFCLCLLVGFR